LADGPVRVFAGQEAAMASSRDQAARIIRPDPQASEPSHLRDASVKPVDEKPMTPAPEAPAAPAAAPAASAEPKAAPAKSGKRRLILMSVGVLALLAAVAYGVNYYFVGRFLVSTDDAYIRANNSTLGARVAGHIAAIVPGDNTTVKAGDVVFRIDDGDYKIAVEAARAKIATQQATIERIGRQVVSMQSAVEQAQAQLTSTEAAATRSQLDFDRQQALSTKGFASRAVFESSQAGRDQSAAAVQSAKAALDAAKDNVEVTKAQQNEARAQLRELESNLAKAERDLAFTEVRAPVDGVFSNRIANTGDFISAGQRLGNVVPLNDVFIDANFKETQLARLKPGQPVSISVDAYGSRKVEGTVASLSPAAGAVFTLLPPDNATGNFTKIVQRVPVRIRIPADVAKDNSLRAGMSVYVTIDTKDGAR
jgi:membrane fusion protein (multidrug efflux system)